MILDNEILKNIDFDNDLTVPWYFIGKYARDEANVEIMSEKMLTRLHSKLYNNKDTYEHRYLEYLGTDEYPPGIEMGLKEVIRIYGGK